MSLSIANRIGRLERDLGGGDQPRRVTIWWGDFSESWVERRPGDLQFYVKVPAAESDDDAGLDPLLYLSPEMRAMIRPDDQVAVFEACGIDCRQRHLQHDLPPCKRRLWRFVEDGDGQDFEVQGDDGTWRRLETA